MSRKQQVAVLGLGRFGSTVAVELTQLGHEVLAIDSSERIVQDISDKVTHAVQADMTDLATLEELGLAKFDQAVVATSSNLEVSILATVMLRQLGVTRIVAKAANRLHGSILEQVGASRVVYPEHETGLRLARSFAAPGVHDYLDVGPGYGIARIGVSEAWTGKSLGELNLRVNANVNVMAIYRAGAVTLNPDNSERLSEGDEVVVAGLDEDLQRLEPAVSESS